MILEITLSRDEVEALVLKHLNIEAPEGSTVWTELSDGLVTVRIEKVD